MARLFPQPVVLVSRCLGFDSCRYDGQKLHSPIVNLLEGHVRFIDVCPEVEAGLGVPRAPIRLFKEGDHLEVWQSAKCREVTPQLQKASCRIAKNLAQCDGVILKSKSPSCGIYDAKVFHRRERPQFMQWGSGVFGEKISVMASHKAVDDEMRLSNLVLREHFLIKLYINARFREISVEKKIGELVSFHASHKLLFLAYNQERFRECGRVVANHEALSKDMIFTRYSEELNHLLRDPFRREAMVNTLYHAYGWVSKGCAKDEKEYIVNTIEEYRDERIPLQAVTRLLYALALRFRQQYLLDQVLLEPFPSELSLLTDSGKGRRLK